MNIDRCVIGYPAIITYSKCVPDINNFNKRTMTNSRDLGGGVDRAAHTMTNSRDLGGGGARAAHTHTLPLSSPV